MFFFHSGSDALVSSKSPPSDAVMYRGLFCWGVRGSDQRNPADWNLTADPWCEWLMSNVTVKLNRGCCTFDFIGHHVRLTVLWSKDLQYLSLCGHNVEAQLNNIMIFMVSHSSAHLLAQYTVESLVSGLKSLILWILHIQTYENKRKICILIGHFHVIFWNLIY